MLRKSKQSRMLFFLPSPASDGCPAPRSILSHNNLPLQNTPALPVVKFSASFGQVTNYGGNKVQVTLTIIRPVKAARGRLHGRRPLTLVPQTFNPYSPAACASRTTAGFNLEGTSKFCASCMERPVEHSERNFSVAVGKEGQSVSSHSINASLSQSIGQSAS